MKRILLSIALLLVTVLLIGSIQYCDTANSEAPAALHWSEKPIRVRVDIPDGMSAPGGVMYLKDVPAPYYEPVQAFEDGCYVQSSTVLGQTR
ncbi:MAG: hypothetical protein IKM51_04515, partial [Oscillospiraceae bacterium]|nr:hypothetical protein [Oscillospiraceae bacterium]